MRVRRAVAGGLVAAVVVAGVGGCEPAPYSWDQERITRPMAGERRSGYVWQPIFSQDGTKVLFASDSDDHSPVDDNGFTDTYVRDLVAGTTSLVSVDAEGGAANARSGEAVFSPDGTKVAFISHASDLVPGGTRAGGLYLRDLVGGTTTLLSTDEAGNPWPGNIVDLAFSPDGTAVAFVGLGREIGPTDPYYQDVYLHDLATRTTTLVSATPSGAPGNADSQWPVFAAGGRAVVFVSEASDLGPVDTNGRPDVYVRDLDTGTTALVSENLAGTGAGNGQSALPVVSPDGRLVAFSGEASDLVAGDTGTIHDVFVRDLATGETMLVSAGASGTGGGDDHSAPFYQFSPMSFSGDGRLLAFPSDATNLVPGDDNDDTDVFVRDLAASTTTLVSARADGRGTANGQSWEPVLNETGTAVVFASRATDLGPLDGDNRVDVYVRDLEHGVTGLVSAGPVDGTGDGDAGGARFAPTGDRLAYRIDTPGGDPFDDEIDLVVATGRQADVAAAIEAGTASVPSGGELTYRATLTNAGPDTATDAGLAVLLPEDVTFRGATASVGSCASPAPDQPRAVPCRLGDVADGGVASIEVTVTVDAPAGSTLEALALAASSTGDPGRSDGTATATTPVT